MSALHLLRRRPAATFSVIGGAGALGYANLIEFQADFDEQRHLQDPSVPAAALPRVYDWDGLNSYWKQRPITTVKRFASILTEFVPLAGAYVRDFVLHKPSETEAVRLQLEHAANLREGLTNLGPAFVKAGQQLSIRPDLVPPAVLKELQKLCDAVRPIPDDVAFDVMREELHEKDLDQLFTDLKLVASASLGQVYKGTLKSGETVAIKVQRPDMRRSFSLDLFLLQRIGVLVDLFTSTFTNQPPFHKALYESFSRGSYSELDYENEAANQILFRKELSERNVPVVVPKVYQELTSERVLTSEWIEGVKLSDSPKHQIRKLIPVGVELFLTQLLDIGVFHADPHPGKSQLFLNTIEICLGSSESRSRRSQATSSSLKRASFASWTLACAQKSTSEPATP